MMFRMLRRRFMYFRCYCQNTLMRRIRKSTFTLLRLGYKYRAFERRL